MSDNTNIPEVGSPISHNAVSIYGQSDAMDDFPVLKAFQQYVDAEHAKAQKRMTTLCIFFVILMVAVIGVFVLLLMSISSRNNDLSNQIFQLMLKDRDRQNVIVQSPGAGAQNDIALKAMADMQTKMAEQQMKFAEEMMKNAREREAQAAAQVRAQGAAAQVAAEAPVTQSERSELAAQQRAAAAEAEKLRKAQAAMKAEREKLAKEKERLKEKEIELQRRKLYPELYAERPVQKPAAAQDDEFAELDAALAKEEESVRNIQSGAAPAAAPREIPQRLPQAQPSAQQDSLGAIKYFSYDDDDDLDAFVDSLDIPSRRREPSNAGPAWNLPEE